MRPCTGDDDRAQTLVTSQFGIFEKYEKILHGEAVAKGMFIASKISYLEGHISQKYLNTIKDLLDAYKFDLSVSQYQYKDLKPFIFRDKKIRSGKLNLVLLGGPSKAIITSSFDSNNLKKSLTF